MFIVHGSLIDFLGFYSIININSEYQRLFYLPSTECHNSGAQLASDVIEVLKNKTLSKDEIYDQLWEFSKTRCDNDMRKGEENEVSTIKSPQLDQNTTLNIMLQNSLSASTFSLTKQNESSYNLAETTPAKPTSPTTASSKRNLEMSATDAYTTRESTTDGDVFLLRIPKSNLLEINADILIASFFTFLLVFVILLILLCCCCLSHLPSTSQYFKCNQVRNVPKKYDTEGITKVSI